MGGIFPAYDDRYAKIHFKKWRRGATTSETDFEIVSYLEYDKKKIVNTFVIFRLFAAWCLYYGLIIGMVVWVFYRILM